MTAPELLDRILALPIGDRWHLVQAILNSIQAETNSSHDETNGASSSEKETKASKPGLNRGAMVMSADFDDPLPDSFWGL